MLPKKGIPDPLLVWTLGCASAAAGRSPFAATMSSVALWFFARARARGLLTDRACALVWSPFMRKNLSGTRIAEGAGGKGTSLVRAQAWEAPPTVPWLSIAAEMFLG